LEEERVIRLWDQTFAACLRSLIRATRIPIVSTVEEMVPVHAEEAMGRKSMCLS
jgi:hypothetical protein